MASGRTALELLHRHPQVNLEDALVVQKLSYFLLLFGLEFLMMGNEEVTQIVVIGLLTLRSLSRNF